MPEKNPFVDEPNPFVDRETNPFVDAKPQKPKTRTVLSRVGEAAGGFASSVGQQAQGFALPITGAMIGGPLGGAAGLATSMLLHSQKPTPEPEDVLANLGLAPQQSEFQSGNAAIGPPEPSILNQLIQAISPKALSPQQRAALLGRAGERVAGGAAKAAGLVSTAAPEIQKEGLTPKTGGMLAGDIAGMLTLARALRTGGDVAPTKPFLEKYPTAELKFSKSLKELDEAERLSFEFAPKAKEPTTTTSVPVAPRTKPRRFSKESQEFENIPKPKQMAEQVIADADVAPSTNQIELRFSDVNVNPSKTFRTFAEEMAGLSDEPNYFQSTLDWLSQVEKRLSRIDYGRQLMSYLREIAPDNGRVLGDVENIMHGHGLKRTIFGKPPHGKLTIEEAQNAHQAIQGLAEPLTENVRKIVPAMREVYDYLFRKAKEVGFEDLRYIKDFQPRMLKKDVLDVIYNYSTQMRAWAQQILRERTKDPYAVLQSDKQMAEIINSKTFDTMTPPEVVSQFIENYKASGFGKTTGEALADLSRWAGQEYKMPFGSFDYTRKSKFPIEWYENDARVVFDNYIRRAAKRIAEAKWVGLNGEKGLLLQSRIAEQDATLGNLADTVLRRMLWIEDLPRRSRAAKGFEEFNAWYQYGSKVVPSLLVYAQQPLQPFISFMNQVGYIRGFKALGKSIFDRDMRELVRRSGVAQTDVFEATTGLASNQKMANAVRTAGSGFGWLNVFNKRWAVAAYNDFLHDLHNLANNPHSARGNWARKTLDEMGVDWRNPISPDDILRTSARLATDSQLQSNILLEPEVMSQPGVRTLFTLKRFTIKQWLWQKNMLTSEARKGNVLPILRAGLASVGAGELYIWLRDKYKSALRGEKVYREEDAMWKRLINDVAYSSVFGWVGSLAGAGLTRGVEGLAQQAGYLVSPTLPLVPQNLFDLAEKSRTAESSGGMDLKDAAKFVLKTQFPLMNDFVGYRYLTDSEDVVLARKFKFVKEIDRITKIYFDKKNIGQAKRAVEIWNKNHPYQDRIIPPWAPELDDRDERFDDLTAHRMNQINSRAAQQMQLIRIMREGLQNKK